MARAGQPTKYTDKTAELAYKYALLGATDEDLARSFEVDVATISNWKLSHPEFLESLKSGKDEADANVGKSLYRRALGYDHPEVDIKVINGEIVKTPLVKYYPPDTTAAIFWLKNRQRTKWRDMRDTDITSNGETITEVKKLSDEELNAKIKDYLDTHS